MKQPYRHLVVVMLSAIACSACGQGDSAPIDEAKAESFAAAPDSSAQASPSSRPAADAPAGDVDPDAEYDKGADLAAAGRFTEARRVFEVAARLAPTNGSLAAAVAMFSDLAAKRVSEGAVQRLFQAGQHANAGRWAEAHADVNEAIRLVPDYARAYGLRGTLLLHQGKPAEALKAFDQVVKLDPELAEGYYNRGATQAALNQHDAAIRDFTRAIEIQPDFWDAYANRGSTYQNRGFARDNQQDLRAAMADYTKAHELAPRAVEPLYLRGVLYALSEQWGDAETDFTAVIERDGAHASAFYDRGLAYQNQGDDDRAIADYTKSIELNPSDPAPLINRGLLYAKQQSYERAIADADRAASLAPAMLNPHYNKGLALEQLGRSKEAAAEYRILLRKAGSVNNTLTSLARQRLAAIE
jgi:tetratricopeptide (TPR) repeat protein